MAVEGLAQEASTALPDCSRIIVFDLNGEAFSNCQVLPGELQQMIAAFDDRDTAIQHGVCVEGRRYEVHNHHPPLIYGRSMADCEPETSSGVALCRVDHSRLPGGGPAYLAVTWEQPHTSARIVPRVSQFAQQKLAAEPA